MVHLEMLVFLVEEDLQELRLHIISRFYSTKYLGEIQAMETYHPFPFKLYYLLSQRTNHFFLLKQW